MNKMEELEWKEPNLKLSERDFLSQILDLLTLFDWQFEHTFEQRTFARRTSKGYPDITAVRPPRLLFIELKSERGKLTPNQIKWINLLEQCQKSILLEPVVLKHGKALIPIIKAGQKILTIPEIYCWRPSDGEPNGGRILEILR